MTRSSAILVKSKNWVEQMKCRGRIHCEFYMVSAHYRNHSICTNKIVDHLLHIFQQGSLQVGCTVVDLPCIIHKLVLCLLIAS